MENILRENSTVSIICAAYNAALFIEQTICSILNQSYSDWELIIVDDFSQDNTVEIIENYSKNNDNIVLLKNSKNLGPGLSRNLALQNSHGRYIAFCDSDDLWFPEKLEKQIEFMVKNHNIPISYTAYELIDSTGKPMDRIVEVPTKPIGYVDYLKNTIIGFSTSMIDRNICSNIYIPDMRSREDTYLWTDLLKRGYKAYGLNTVLVKYRIHDNSVSANKLKAAKQVWELYRDALQIPFFVRIYYFICYIFHALKKRYG